MAVRNPVEWGSDHLNLVAGGLKSTIESIHRPQEAMRAPAPAVRRITLADLGDALRKGFQDFIAYRTDVIFLCLLYPVIGLVMARLVIGEERFQLLFPLASGFALIGPFIGIGLYEMSRRREQGETVNWATAFQVLRSPSAGAILLLGLMLMAIFLAWLFAAEEIYGLTMGPHYHPASITAFARDVLTTGAGWTMMAAGIGVGFLFALLVFTLTVVSFPLLIDRQDVGLDVAIGTSIRAVAANPGPMAVWGLIVAGSLIVGSIPLFIGLALTTPILGHATWHLYRKLVARPSDGA